MIPKPPSRKKEFDFNDPDFHKQKNEFQKQIRDIIFKFYKIIPRSRNRDLLLKFAENINPIEPVDVTRLPYVGREKNAASKNKLACVFALISWVIRRYWVFCKNPDCKLETQKLIKQLETIYNNGLDQYQVDGDLAKGFYLEKK